MSSRVLAYLGTNRIPLTVASEIIVKGATAAKRLVSAIDPEVLKAMAYKVEDAYNGNIMLSEGDKKQITEVEITYARHASILVVHND